MGEALNKALHSSGQRIEAYGLTYQKNGAYLIPNLAMDNTTEDSEEALGKYGMLRQTYLQENRSGTYTSMLLTGKLWPHLLEIDKTAQTRVDTMLTELMKQHGVDEKLKASDPMKWVQEVNNEFGKPHLGLPNSLFTIVFLQLELNY